MVNLSVYDFSKSKVRKNGKVLDKYTIALEIRECLGYNSSLPYVIYNRLYTYKELVSVLQNAILNA